MRAGAPAALLARVAIFGISLASCSSLMGWATRSSLDWHSVQSVGGIAIGTPYRNEDGDVFLPIRCDVSGLQTITVPPTRQNSGLDCAPPDVWISGQVIYITVRTQVAQDGGSALCPDAELGDLPAGHYFVFYATPGSSEHPLGAIDVPGP